jgi:DNA adenine methylase
MPKSSSVSFPKPILKWVGGKTQIIDTVIKGFPKIIQNYHEPFIGGGSVLLGLLHSIKTGSIQVNGHICAYDANSVLIGMYKNIQTKHIELLGVIQTLIGEYTQCTGTIVNRAPATLEEAMQSKENYYYWSRGKYNSLDSTEKMGIEGSALFIFLNKTGFRGMFRIGPNGFNIPYGNYKNPEIINEAHLYEIHTLIQGVQFECADFTESLAKVGDGDFVYLDPPYAPENATSFVGYTEAGFGLDKHQQLFEMCNTMTVEKKWMMSNADVPLVRTYLCSPSYNIMSIMCKRSINSKNPEAKAKEVIITNY